MSDWFQDPGPTYTLVRIEGEDLARLDRLCSGSDKSKNEVISSALYVLEQSLMAKEEPNAK